jgi:NADP-dependent 3-hydroxy acid dehydrogenase YdfG
MAEIRYSWLVLTEHFSLHANDPKPKPWTRRDTNIPLLNGHRTETLRNQEMATQPLVILVTGASTGFGLLTAQTLAQAGHSVYGGNLHPYSKLPQPYDDATAFSQEHYVQLKGIQLDVISEESCKTCVDEIIVSEGKIDVVVHNAGHMNFGPGEAFTPEQFMHLFDGKYSQNMHHYVRGLMYA